MNFIDEEDLMRNKEITFRGEGFCMVMIKTAAHNKTQVLNLINNFIGEFQNWCNQRNAPEFADFEKYLTKQFQISSNGNVIGKDLHDYTLRVKKFREEYSHFEITMLEEPLICENKVVLTYEVDLRLNPNQDKREVYVMAIVNLEDNKISNWKQVTHDKGSQDWA
ncbi:MAG: hypothetical protein Q8K60_01990 [Parachlamydiaceae bacterium]|nr:hypothetical protein [Parachlamydiaceae bacterium]